MPGLTRQLPRAPIRCPRRSGRAASVEWSIRSGDALRAGLFFKYRDLWRLSGEAELAPARHHTLVSFLVELGTRREWFDVLVVHARIDECLGTPRADFRRVEARIEECAPRFAENVDRLRRPRARCHRP